MSKPVPPSRAEARAIAEQPTLPIAIARHAFRKVPEVTVFFWIIKLLTTAMGEATSDALVSLIDPIIAVALGALGLAIVLVLQFSVRRYVAWIYWLTAIMVAIFGTMAADVLHVGFGIPYAVSATGFAVVLLAIFAIWYWSERTLSIHSIYTRRRELFYWATIMATFALGTAVGDLTATTLGLGYFASGVLFTVLILLPALAYWIFGLNEILVFWLCYILTRPLGASFADWMGKPRSAGGLDFGDGRVSLVLTAVIIVFIVYLTITRKDIQDEQKTSHTA
jgi:uncharacterized membrane-anchored protein